ncbi:hypothetical protein ACHHV8_22055 [Paenibacillus sp. TAB 01]|uniref:hypothetical protein n=1 Tax=Paenibacillus sp. TAB 01 TaxID=3368988 RepID=UPI00375220CC
MRMTVKNKCIRVGSIKISGVGSSSLVLIGDAEVITCSSYFDTPADSLIYSPAVPLIPPFRELPAAAATDAAPPSTPH